MVVVIFEAEINRLDDEYFQTAVRMRELARDYGCIDFVSLTENGREIAVSTWKSHEDIIRWKADPEHHKAQEKGKETWYKSFKVRVAEVQREYTA